MAEEASSGGSEGGSPGIGADTNLVTEAESTGTGADTGNILDWRGGLERDLRDSPTLQKYNSVNELAKAHDNLQRLHGEMFRIPRGDDRASYERAWEKLGWPKEGPTGYQITDPEMPSELPFAGGIKDRLLQMGHVHGLTNTQMQGVADDIAAILRDGTQMMAGQKAMQQAEAKKELARAFGSEAARRIEEANLLWSEIVAGRFSGEYGMRLAEKFPKSDLANDPDMVASLAALYRGMHEGEFVDGMDYGGTQHSESALQAEAAELQAKRYDPKTPASDQAAIQARLLQIRGQLAESDRIRQARQATLSRR